MCQIIQVDAIMDRLLVQQERCSKISLQPPKVGGFQCPCDRDIACLTRVKFGGISQRRQNAYPLASETQAMSDIYESLFSPSRRRRSSSKYGGNTTTPRDRTVRWATARQTRKPSSRWQPGRSCNNIQNGPIKRDRSVELNAAHIFSNSRSTWHLSGPVLEKNQQHSANEFWV